MSSPSEATTQGAQEIELVAGIYTGYRAMTYVPSQGRIRSPHRDYEWWPERESVSALCSGQMEDHHDVPGGPQDRHRCGFYAYYRLEDAEEEASSYYIIDDREHFVVLVAYWGRVIHHKTYSRSSRMEVIAVFDPSTPYPYARLAGKLGVPCLGRTQITGYAEVFGKLLSNGEVSLAGVG